ncbi:cytochrome C chain A [Geotalea uraniireducens]|uniref:Cytochrome C chain A n=1 Tax=Geotalea uraniireducens TaxID=351604 RepID=A0ABM8EIP1_9BACT|nr:C-GCAxxG-C-C family protein [Geotalea uraniireducens]BDV42265.1 cytochrome C chain A [Geotalea uraniireducens]
MESSRREMLGLLGVAIGTAAVAPLLGQQALAVPVRAKAGDAPWPYVPLDPKAVAERAYEAYLDGHCMYGTFAGIVGELAALKGAPYNTFPLAMMKYGAGGGAEWGTLCGTLNGSAAAIALLSKNPTPLIDELFGWYQTAKLPDYRPGDAIYEIAPSVARSPLCHVSVSRWCKATGLHSLSKERYERCGWLAACCAKKAVELLNSQAAGKFQASYPLPARVQECRGCHDRGGVVENTRGKMECGVCHFSLGTGHTKI